MHDFLLSTRQTPTGRPLLGVSPASAVLINLFGLFVPPSGLRARGKPFPAKRVPAIDQARRVNPITPPTIVITFARRRVARRLGVNQTAKRGARSVATGLYNSVIGVCVI
jgi:hypothetical protein